MTTIRFSYKQLGLTTLILGAFVFSGLQLFQPTVATADHGGGATVVSFDLMKKLSGPFPNTYSAAQFSFNIVGTATSGDPINHQNIQLDTVHSIDTATTEIDLPAGEYVITENGPNGFVPSDWTIQWSGDGCENTRFHSESTTIVITEHDLGLENWGCRADNQFKPVADPVLGCTNPIAENYNPAATQDDGSCIINNDDPETGVIIIEKQTNPDGNQTLFTFNPSWSGTDFTLMDGQQNSSSALATGTYSIVESVTSGWMQTSATCSDGSSINTISLQAGETITCVFTNTLEGGGGNQCVDETLGSWADSVVSSSQGNTKALGPITNPDRIDPADTLDAEDWAFNGDTGFFSLGFGGSIVLSFDSYVPNVVGTDITVYEATNGDAYPSETATVEVSQNGTTWVLAGTANNATIPSRTTAIDFNATGFDWIRYVRITDTTNATLHTNDADGFDLDAVQATQQLCDEPDGDGGNGGDEPTYLLFGYVWHDENENDVWDKEEPNPADDETDLNGWVVNINNGTDSHSTTTDQTGYYYFYVPAGMWTISEVLQSGWGQTFPNSNTHVVEVLNGTTTTYGPYDFGNVFFDGTGGCTSNCGGGSNGDGNGDGNGKKVELTNSNGNSNGGNGNGNDDNEDRPIPQVLGESTTAMPYGAPNTGKGGTAPLSVQLQSLLAIVSVRKDVEVTHEK